MPTWDAQMFRADSPIQVYRDAAAARTVVGHSLAGVCPHMHSVCLGTCTLHGCQIASRQWNACAFRVGKGGFLHGCTNRYTSVNETKK